MLGFSSAPWLLFIFQQEHFVDDGPRAGLDFAPGHG